MAWAETGWVSPQDGSVQFQEVVGPSIQFILEYDATGNLAAGEPVNPILIVGGVEGAASKQVDMLTGSRSPDPGVIVWQFKFKKLGETEWTLSSEHSFTLVEGSPGPPEKAVSPVPANNADRVDPNALALEWSEGGTAGQAAWAYDVYMGPAAGSLTKVADQLMDATSYVVQDTDWLGIFGDTLPYRGATYWRVDATNDYGTTTGDVWLFNTSEFDFPAKPINPTPAHEAVSVRLGLALLDWETGV